MDRGSIEISTFEPTLASGALVASDHPSANLEPPSAESAPRADPSCARRVVVPASSGDRSNGVYEADRRYPFSPTRRSRDGFSGRRLATGAAAACISLAFHALLLTSILWTSGVPAHRPHDAGTLKKAVPEASDDGALQVTFIQELSSNPSGVHSPSVGALRSPKAIVPISIPTSLAEPSLSVPDFSTEPASAITTPAPDVAVRSAMYGRYVGQINARIERAWRRPRTAIGAPLFTCFVRIDQDSRGTVLDVTLEQCNGSERWQLSLVSAIEAASPLPAPPDPAVFTRTLHLSFQSQPYSSGAPQDAYEPIPRAMQLSDAGSPEKQNERALAAFAQALREPSSHKVISLRLAGSPPGHAPTEGPSPPLEAAPAQPPPPPRPPAE